VDNNVDPRMAIDAALDGGDLPRKPVIVVIEECDEVP
jgi:hypothetical protein